MNERDQFVVHADRGDPQPAPSDVSKLVTANHHATVDLDGNAFRNSFDSVDKRRFGQTQTGYKEWAVERLQQHHTESVSYTGGNNVTYTKTCEPNQSDISVQSVTPVYLPQVRQPLSRENTRTRMSTSLPGPRGSRERMASTNVFSVIRPARTQRTPTVRTAGA